MLILFFSRLAELYNGIQSLICMVILLFVMIVYQAFLYVFQPFVDDIYQNVFSGVMLGFTVGLILQIIHVFVPSLDSWYVFYSSLILSFIGFFISKFIQAKIFQKVETTLNELANNEIDFDKKFSSAIEFLVYIRGGFKKGNPYVLSWKPFNLALEKWPNNAQIWIQYIRFIIIFYEERGKLDQILKTLKSKKIKDTYLELFCAQIQFIQEGRNQDMTKDLKYSLKVIEEEIAQIRNLIVIYWNTIQDCSVNSSYEICNNLQNAINSCISKFNLLASMRPTNYIVAQKYAQFLEEIVFDPKSAYEWRLKESYFRKTNGYYLDQTQFLGFTRFPNLPHDIKTINSDSYIISDTSLSTDLGSSLRSESSTQYIDVESNVPDFARSNIKEMANNTEYDFLKKILGIMALCITAFNVISLFPMIISSVNMWKLNFFGNSVESFCSVNTDFSSIAIYITHSFLEQSGYPTFELNNTNNSLIINLLSDINSNADNIENSLTNEGIEIINTDYISKIQVPIEFYGENLTVLQSINYLNSNLFYHSNLNSTQITIFEEQFDKLQEPIKEVVEDFTKSSISVFSDLFSYHLICSIVCLFLMFISMFPLIKFILNIKEHWTYIIKTLNTIPRVAIQKVIKNQKVSNDEEKLQKEEFKYHYLFVNMASSRSSTSGIPVYRLIGLMIFLFIISFIVALLFAIYINQSSVNPSFSMLYYTISNTFKILYYYSNILLRSSKSNDILIFNDTKESIYNSLGLYSSNLSELIDSLLYQKWNGNNIGLLFSSNEIMKELTKWNNNFSLDDIDNLPDYMLLDIAKSILIKYCDLIHLDMNFNVTEFDSDLYFAIQILTSHFSLNVMPKLLEDAHELFTSTINGYRNTVIIAGIIFFFVGVLVIVFIFILYFDILRSFRYLLSYISMIDPDYYKDLPNVMKLYSGVSEGKVETNLNIKNMYQRAEAEIPESIFELDHNFNILKLNSSAMKLCQIDNFNVEETQQHINLYITFEDFDILKELKLQVTRQYPQKNTFQTKIRINSSNEIIETKLTSIIVSDEKTCLILILSDTNENSNEVQEVQIYEQKIKEMIESIVPNKLRNIFESEKKNQISSDSSLVITIDLCNFNEFCTNHSSQESLEFINNFKNYIDYLCNEKETDLININTIGNVFVLCCNINNQTLNYYNAILETVRFVHEVYEFAKNNYYKIKCCILMNKNVISILSQNRAGFFMYSPNIHLAMNTLHAARSETLIIGKKIYEMLPQNLVKGATRMHVNGKGLYMLDLQTTTN